MTANQTQTKRKRGGQKGNRNARKHGFYSGALSPAETVQMWNIPNLEGVDPEIALIRVNLQSSLQHDPGNRRVIREASRLLVRRYFAEYGLDPSDRKYLKAVVESFLEIASMRHSAGLQSSQKQMAIRRNESCVLRVKCAGGNRLAYEKESSNSCKTSHPYKTNHPDFPAAVTHATSVKWDILER